MSRKGAPSRRPAAAVQSATSTDSLHVESPDYLILAARNLSPRFYKPLFLKPVPHPVQRINHVERVVHSLEFLAHAFDVTVDGTIIDVNLIIVNGIHQGVTAFDYAGAHGECLHDQEFGDGEGDRFVLPGAHVALRVDAELAALKHLTCFRFLPGRALLVAPAAQHCLDALREEPLRERLPDEIMSTHLEAKYFVEFFVFGGEEDHRQVGLFAEAP